MSKFLSIKLASRGTSSSWENEEAGGIISGSRIYEGSLILRVEICDYS